MVQRKCNNCNTKLENRWQLKYCSNKCQLVHQHKAHVQKWKEGDIVVNTKNISKWLKKYLLEKFKNRCSICGWNKKHPKSRKTPLEVDHIDGNSENNNEKNLQLLCPNCHSLTPNFKNFNRGRGRKWRIKKYLKN